MANQPKHLYRDVDNKMIGGVCAGLAEYFGIDVTIVRVLAVFLAFAWGTAIIAYIIMWIVVPVRPTVITTPATAARAEGEPMSGSAQDPRTAATDPHNNTDTNSNGNAQHSEPGDVNTDFAAKNHPTPTVTAPAKHGGVYFGVFLVLAGVFALLANMFGNFSWWALWPLFIVAAGVVQMFFPDYGKPWTPWRIVDGLITIGVGLVFLGCTVGWFSWSLFWTFFTYWPVLIIAGGFGILGAALKQRWVSTVGGIIVALALFTAALTTYTGPGGLPASWQSGFPFAPENSQGEIVYDSDTRTSEPLDGTRNATLTLQSGAGQYTIGALESGSDHLFTTESTKRDALSVSSEGSRSDKEVAVATNNTSTAAQIDLSRDVTWDLVLNSGATDNHYDLRHLKVSDVRVETGASNTELDLGTPVNDDANVTIESGFAAITITVPDNVPVRIVSETGLASKDFHGLVKQADGSYVNEEYAEASGSGAAWNISIKGGLAAFTFK